MLASPTIAIIFVDIWLLLTSYWGAAPPGPPETGTVSSSKRCWEAPPPPLRQLVSVYWLDESISGVSESKSCITAGASLTGVARLFAVAGAAATAPALAPRFAFPEEIAVAVLVATILAASLPCRRCMLEWR